jgi:hypothetical protein
MQNSSRDFIEHRIKNLEAASSRSEAKFRAMIEREQALLAALDAATPAPANAIVHELEPATDAHGAPTFTRANDVLLPSPSVPPDAPSIDDAPELARYVPTPEVLALTDAADVLTELGKLETAREEHELVSAWAVAGNREALTAIAVHVGGPIGDRAARSLKRIGFTDPSDPA